MTILSIDDADFGKFIEKNPYVVIKFIADWCGSCKIFAPKFKRISSNEKFQKIKFIEIDAEKNIEVRKLAKVDNLPFIAIFKNGEYIAGKAISLEDKAIEFIENNLL